jgi:predicted dehydrogenase
MTQITRRTFTKSVAAATMLSPLANVRGANNDIRVGVCGMGGRGTGAAGQYQKLSDARVVAVCDPDPSRVEKAKSRNKGAEGYTDIRKMLENKDIDAVVVSTCNHWHSLGGIWACQAGKDVYVEKPISHNIWEGRQLVKAARKYDRMVQGGTQQRSDPVQAEIKAYIASGAIGKPQYIRANRYGQRGSIGKRDTALKIPQGVNYDLWLGPAADEPLFRNQLHYDWHWMWNTGNGEMGNWGVHILDDVRNVGLLDKHTLPKRVVAAGGRIAWNDAGDSPNVHSVYFDTGDVPVIFDLTNLPVAAGKRGSPAYRGVRSGFVIQCENGYYAGGRGGGWSYANDGKRLKKFKGTGGPNHPANFVKAIRSRKKEDLNAEIEKIHYSSAWCHLGNIATRLGGALDPAKAKALYKESKPWQETIDGLVKHIGANGVNMDHPGLRLGPVLELDVEKETFIGNSATDEAKALLRRKYRKGFEVPEKV